jgi:hypothetical protein
MGEAASRKPSGSLSLMNGGPATVYGPRAYAAFREFAAGTPQPRTPKPRGWIG